MKNIKDFKTYNLLESSKLSNVKKEVIQSLIRDHGYGKEKADILVHKHIDILEVNVDEASPKDIANSIEEEEMQHGDE